MYLKWETEHGSYTLEKSLSVRIYLKKTFMFTVFTLSGLTIKAPRLHTQG